MSDLHECCAGEGYPGIAHDLMAARKERDEALAALRAIRNLPSTHVLLFNAEAKAMAYIAARALEETA